MNPRHFLTLRDLSVAEHEALFARAAVLKAERAQGRRHTTLAGRILALVFEKASTRTRLSFEAAMLQLGGHAVVLDAQGSQMARGEPPEDTARVTSRYVDAIMFRTSTDERLRAFARAASMPVINGLSDGGHPVQLLADLLTVRERLGGVHDKTIAFVGDGAGNMARSWVEAAGLFGFDLRIAAPEAYRPPVRELEAAGGRVHVTSAPREAVEGADVVVTDVWTSMGSEEEATARRAELAGYSVDVALVARAAPHAIVLHCLPAHRGEEISDEVMMGASSAIFDEAENRLHVQKALLEKLLATPA
jgi:ornithine carbamoyltransferase